MRYFFAVINVLVLSLSIWGAGGCSSANSDPLEEFEPDQFNGVYTTTEGLNTCDGVILFRDEIEIQDMSIVGFTWTDEDGIFPAQFLGVTDNNRITYEIDFSTDEFTCGGVFTTEGDGVELDVLTVACLGDDLECTIVYGKPH